MEKEREIDKAYKWVIENEQDIILEALNETSKNFKGFWKFEQNDEYVKELYYSAYKCCKNYIFNNINSIKKRFSIKGNEVYRYLFRDFIGIFGNIQKYKLDDFRYEYNLKDLEVLLEEIKNKRIPRSILEYYNSSSLVDYFKIDELLNIKILTSEEVEKEEERRKYIEVDGLFFSLM